MGKKRATPSKNLQWGFKEEFHRKIIHLFSICFLVLYVLIKDWYNHKVALLALSALLIVMLELEYFRVESKWSVPIISWLWKYKRPHEQHRLGAEIFFLIGCIICLAVFDIRIAVAAILMTTFGDITSALCGKAFGRTWVMKGRAMEGIVPEFIVNIIVGYFFVRTTIPGLNGLIAGSGLAGDPMWGVIFVMAFVATFVETMVTKLDDNLLIPVFAGFFGQVALAVSTGVLVVF